MKAYAASWNASKKPRKQRKYARHAPRHVKRVMHRSMLSAPLREELGIQTLPPRKGDTVKVLRGDHRGREGIIERVDRDRGRVYVQGVTRKRLDGTDVLVPIHHSNIMLIKLVEDERRVKRARSLTSRENA